MKLRAHLCLGALGALVACERKPRPWDGAPNGSVVDASQPFLPSAPREGSWLGASTSSPLGSASADPGEAPPKAKVEIRGGGLWRSCSDGFEANASPARDVERLAALCGPPNGMRPAGETLTGTASEAASRHPFEVKSGACYRVFAVSEGAAGGLHMSVLSVRGSRLAAVEEPGRVAMLEPERPFCSFASETLVLEVSARNGQGQYAARIYQLPTAE
ncbi:MAG: hypothetical protein FJ095_17985 [Deltaproteobacteria bacterium]|nr:hypothetical protein [Deltaproteobacteria bacterium]